MPQVTMPQLGEGVEEGTIGKWLKAVGDHVRVGDPLVEVVTDKVNAEVPSPFEGTLSKILVQEGETIGNDAPIAEVDESGPGTAAEAPPKPSAADAAPEPARGRADSCPRARSSRHAGSSRAGSSRAGCSCVRALRHQLRPQHQPRHQPRPQYQPRHRQHAWSSPPTSA